MAEATGVWVRTSTLDTAVYGKIHSTQRRTLGLLSDESDSVKKNWGWARADLIDSLETSTGRQLQLFVRDEESEHDKRTLLLPDTVVADGNLLMANIYREEHDALDHPSSSFDDDRHADRYPDDLVTLTHLHEPAVVDCLRKRYARDHIYTATGSILIALNPFKNCNDLYSERVMKMYSDRGESGMVKRGRGATESVKEEENRSDEPPDFAAGNNNKAPKLETKLPPHVYSIADLSFRTMMSELDEIHGNRWRMMMMAANQGSIRGCDQSILVSGESGAGKTVTTKLIMQYLATLSKRIAGTYVPDPLASRRSSSSFTLVGAADKVNIEQQFLQSNPILESFGNARTLRNDNSSRFGKFIEIQFTKGGTLVGASIETYLLEKVRLITQADGERNYHIFYEILQGMMDAELDRYHLGNYTAEDFRMTNSSGTLDRRDGVDDSETYQDLMNAMDTLGFAVEEQDNILNVTCAILHASNFTFKSISADESEIDRDNLHLDAFLSLMGVTTDALNRAMCYFSIQAGKEKHVRSVSKQKAEKGTEALIKATYGALFTHIVQRINDCITLKDSASKLEGSGGRGVSAGSGGKPPTIVVLDIFGFESFQFNSFEQLCINYCNEALQQQFNLFVLKNEQEEYEREGIQWSFISYPENQDVLDLIDKKGSGILNILDDQCRAPGTTDKTFANDLYQKCTGHSRFQADFRQVGARKFAVMHYAGTVEYDTEGFVEKNRDELPKEASELLLSSSNVFVRRLAAFLSGPAANETGAAAGPRSRSRGASAGSRTTVGGQFSKQLQVLRQKIDLTSPNYIRCLKPNDQLVPNRFDPVIVADQLRCAGVVEAVRVSRVGYPHRYSHQSFVWRYRVLGLKALKFAARSSSSHGQRKPVEILITAIAQKIADSEAPSGSSQNSNEPTPCDELVESNISGIQVGKTKVFLRREIHEVLERLRNQELRGAAVKLQTAVRRYIIQREYITSQKMILRLQCYARTIIAIKAVDTKRRNHNATVIQTAYRRTTLRRLFICVLTFTLWIQKTYRGRVGRIKYGRLNKERKSVILQKYWRACHYSKLYLSRKKCATVIQCAARCWLARLKLNELTSHARDFQKTALERDELRRETHRLQLQLAEAMTLAKKESERASAADLATLHASSKQSLELDVLRDEVSAVSKETEKSRVKADETMSKKVANPDMLDIYHNDKIGTVENTLEETSTSVERLSKELESEKKGRDELKELLDTRRGELDIKEQESNDLRKELETTRRELDSVRLEMVELKRELGVANDELRQFAHITEKKVSNGHFSQTAMLHDESRHVEVDFEGSTTGEEDKAAKVDKVNNRLHNKQLSRHEFGNAAEEIFTLQDEVQRLNRELAAADKVMMNSNGGDDDGSYDMSWQDVESRRVADAAVMEEKDNEIKELQQEIIILKDQLDAATTKSTTSVSSVHLEDHDDDDENRSVWSKFFIRAPPPRNGSGHAFEVVEPSERSLKRQIKSLKKANETLRREAERARNESEFYKFELKEETERSAKELEAFTVTLKGVDDLLLAAESMSKEISKRRQEKKAYPPPLLVSSTNSSNKDNKQGEVSSVWDKNASFGTAMRNNTRLRHGANSKSTPFTLFC